jgi:hypothetical protein
MNTTTFYGTLVPERDAAGRFRRLAEHEAPVSIQDGGMSMIAELGTGNEEGLFVRLQSWDPSKEHSELTSMLGRRISVTVKVLD